MTRRASALAAAWLPVVAPLAAGAEKVPARVIDAGGTDDSARAAAQAASALGWPLVSHADLIGRVGRPAADALPRKEIEAARTLIEQAARRVNAADLQGALSDLAAAAALLDQAPATREQAALRRAEAFLRGRALLAVPDRAGEADAALREAARIDPTAVVQPGEYPPEVIAAYEAARRTVLDGPRARVRVESDPPGARVEVDGVDHGPAPVLLEVPPGPYRLRLSRDGYQTTEARRDLGAGFGEVRAALRKAPGRERAARVAAALAAGATVTAEHIDWLADQARARGALVVRQTAGELEAFWARGGTLHRFPPEPADRPDAGARLAERARRLLAPAPSPGAASPWWKSPWLWGAVGVAAGAAAGAGAVLLLHRDDGADLTVREGTPP